MDIGQIAAFLVTLAAVFSFVNERYFKLPSSIALMLMAFAFSLVIIALSGLNYELALSIERFVSEINFTDTVLHGVLGFLLFAGALHVNFSTLQTHRLVIGLLASVGVILSTFITGYLVYYLLPLVGLSVPLLYCLVFGALISPTDPVAVLAILKRSTIPPALKGKIAGESLFNDGVGVVAFSVLLVFAGTGANPTAMEVAQVLMLEALGGLLLGLLLGAIGYAMLIRAATYRLQILITLALVMGGYAVANAMDTSGPLAMVVAGLYIGNHARNFTMPRETTENLNSFWGLVDEILNALLFLLIGLEFVMLRGDWALFPAALVAVPVILLARWIVVAVPVTALRRSYPFAAGTIPIMTWGGLRGGVSIALALSIPDGEWREIILVMTYAVVLFSVLVQGGTMRRLVSRYDRSAVPDKPL